MEWQALFQDIRKQVDEINAKEIQDAERQTNTPKRAKSFLDDFIVVDVETTGFSETADAIIQLSAVHYKKHEECASFSTYLNPHRTIPSRITTLTGITNAMVSDAPVFDDVAQSFYEFIETAPLLTGYNFTFDLGRLSAAAGFQFAEKYKCFDTLTLARRYIPGLCGYKLFQVGAAIGFTTEFHNALNDCRACGAVLNHICASMDGAKFPIKYCRPSACAQDSETRQARKDYQERQKNTDCPITLDRILPDGRLHGKGIVFTGLLSFGRSTAEFMARQAGAFVHNSVSKKTDYLIVGEQDCRLVGADGLSGKEEDAYRLIDEYGARIKIINEVEYLMLLTQESEAVVLDNQIDILKESGKKPKAAHEAAFLQKAMPAIQKAAREHNANPDDITADRLAGYSSIKFRTSLIARVKFRGKAWRISIPGRLSKIVPKNLPATEASDAKGFLQIPYEALGEDALIDLLCNVAALAISLVPKEFDCCSRYNECSDARVCVHPDPSFSLICGYRKILESGKVFYGVNRNID